MTLPRRLALPALACLLGSASARGDVPPQRPVPPSTAQPGNRETSPWTQQIPLLGEIPREGLCRVEIDPRVQRLAGPDFTSIRLVRVGEDGHRIEEAWVVRRIEAARDPGVLPSPHRIESFEEHPDGSMELVVALDFPLAGPAVFRLEIESPLRDFEKGITVAVPGSDGGWQDLVADGVLFDHSRFLDFRSTGLDLPPIGARRFRLRIAGATDRQRTRIREITRTVGDSAGLTLTEHSQVEDRPFRIDGLRFVHLPPRSARPEPRRRSLPLVLLGQGSPSEGLEAFEFNGGFLPLDRLRFQSGDRNFRRQVELQVPAGNGWRTLQRGRIHHYEVGDFRDSLLEMVIPETRADRYRLVVDNRGLPAVTLTEIQGHGPLDELVFLGSPGRSYLLLLGAADPPRHRFDAAAIGAALDRRVPVHPLELGDLGPDPLHTAAMPPPPPGLLESRTALRIGIALAVAVLVWVLHGTLRKVESQG